MSTTIGKRSSPSVVYPVTLHLNEAYPLGDLGTVYVYFLEPQGGQERKISEGFLVTFADEYTENVWGHGNTPLEALEDAEEEWKRIANEFVNPFTKALEKRADQEDWRWE